MTTATPHSADLSPFASARIEALEAKIDALTENISRLAEGQRRQKELISEMMPVARQAVAVMGERIDELDRRGYFHFGNELLGVLDRIVANYSPDDVRALGDNIVFILDGVRSVTQPDVMELAHQASVAIREAETDEAKTLWGMFKESKDDDIRRGMAVMLEILRHVGKSAHRTSHNKRLEAIAPSQPEPRRPSAPAPQTTPAPPPTSCAVPDVETGAGEAAVYIDGVGFNDHGFMLDSSQWTKELAGKVAAAVGLNELTESHWKVIDFARNDFEENGASPNIRRISKYSGVGTKDLYLLFPQAPGIMVAQIAGIPKPKGCI